MDAKLAGAEAEARGEPNPVVAYRPPTNPDGSGGEADPKWFEYLSNAMGEHVRGAVAAGRSAPLEPQRALVPGGVAMHPYAPFKGMPAVWESHVYDDGSTFEGLTFARQPHGPGVMVAGTDGAAGGIAGLEPGDRYEGEWYAGWATGLGISLTGSKLFKGEWMLGKRHGCGVEVDLAPYYEAVAGGADPEEAWDAHAAEIEGRAVSGTWVADKHIARPAPDTKGKLARVKLSPKKFPKGWIKRDTQFVLCTAGEVEATADEVEDIAARAAMFAYKPGGTVANFTQDGSGLPAPLMQDPLHYSHGTKFLAPGPLGQCFALPDDEGLLETMAAAAEAKGDTWDDFNLEYDITPGSDLDDARALMHVEAANELGRAKRRLGLVGRLARVERAKAAAEVDRRRAAAAAQAGRSGGGPAVGEGDALDDADLVAGPRGGSGSGSGRGGRPGGFGSLSVAALHRGWGGGWRR